MYHEALLLTLMALHKEPSFKLLSIISWGWGCMPAAWAHLASLCMISQSAASNSRLPRTGNSRVRLPSSALPSVTCRPG